MLHELGSDGFAAALARLQPLQRVLDKGVGPAELPPFSMVPRNAALVVRFDDLLDGATVAADTLGLFAGSPAAVPFEARVFADLNHGGVAGGRLWPTRVVIDAAVSSAEASSAGIAANALGLPAAATAARSNVVLRIPTAASAAAGQPRVLTALGGGAVAFSGNGSVDPLSPTLDVVRAVRSGGPSALTGDPYNGFLRDDEPPRLLGALPIVLTRVTPPAVPGEAILLELRYGSANQPWTGCAPALVAGNVIEAGMHVFEVIAPTGNPLQGILTGVAVRRVAGDPAAPHPPLGRALIAWDAAGATDPACAVGFSPAAAGPPVAGVDPSADVVLLFDEPMDPASFEATRTFVLEYAASPGGADALYLRVAGRVAPALDARSFTFEPLVPLRNRGAASDPDAYVLRLDGGPGGVTDLAGNPLRDPLPPVTFTLDAGAPRVDSASVTLSFEALDENGDGGSEAHGQFLIDPARGVIRPRAPTRFSAAADPGQPLVGAMIPVVGGVRTPLSGFGSRLMTVWRYDDLGLGLLDDATHNLDVEGLWWEPEGQMLAPDFFPGFEMVLAHSRFLPDEALAFPTKGGGPPVPWFPSSGLAASFDANRADAALAPPTVVHPRAAGYLVQPGDLALSTSGRVIAPWPMNRGLPPEQYRYWTWRDTGVSVVGAPFGSGADTWRLQQIAGTPHRGFYRSDSVPTIGLPLLMDFRTYPDAGARGLNSLRVAMALSLSARPFFRSFTTGGVLAGGGTVWVDPDQAVTAQGGITAPGGNPTPPQDNTFYYGQADFVVRVSRLHTAWFDALGATIDLAAAPESPGPAPGSNASLALAFRGADALSNAYGLEPWRDASLMDPYGDGFNQVQLMKLSLPSNLTFQPLFHQGDPSWRDSIQDVRGARYFQLRVTMIADVQSGATPELAGLGLGFLK